MNLYFSKFFEYKIDIQTIFTQKNVIPWSANPSQSKNVLPPQYLTPIKNLLKGDPKQQLQISRLSLTLKIVEESKIWTP